MNVVIALMGCGLVSPALGPGVSGKGTLVIGVTAGFFVAERPGLARVTASRSTQHFELTVLVS